MLNNEIIKHLDDGIAILDQQGRFTKVNASFCFLLDIKQKKLIGNRLIDLGSQLEPLGQLAKLDTLTEREFVYDANGGQRFLFAKIFTLRTDEGNENGRLLILHDLTKLKQTQHHLQTSRQQFEISQQTMKKALEEAEASSAAKSTFLKTIGHEIRTPLAGVIGMSNLLKDTPLNSEQKELVSTIIANSDSLLNIINNLLELAKIESGGLALNRQPFDLRDSLTALLKPYQLAAKKKSLAFHIELSENMPNIFYGDPIRIRQILTNLLDNAIKFTEEGEIRFSVTPIKIDTTHAELKFTIQDSGIGISTGYLDKVFQPFHQGTDYMTRKHGGTGIGLAICKRLVELMGGYIGFNSQTGQGSTFYFSAVLEISNQAPQQFLQPQPPTLRDKKLLIIAKNAQHRRVISQEARSAGMSPYVAGTASEVNFWLSKSPFDAILVDAQLLGKKTNRLLLEIRNKAPHLPIILLTTSSQSNYKIDASYLSGTLSQPISATAFYDVMVHVLSTRKKRETAATTNKEMATRHPLELLLVEDNPINQKVGSRLLERLGYKIDIAVNGQEGFNAVQEKIYDVILMDVQMPIMDGLEATRKIRQALSLEQQPHIIAVTAHGMDGDKEDFLAAGMDDYISKPLKLETLIMALNRCKPIASKV